MNRILIVEDEKELALNIEEILGYVGYDVVGILDNGKDVLGFLKQNIVDLIYMDIQISGSIDGIELCKIIKSNYNIPVVYLTAFSDKVMLDKIATTSFEGYLLKPFTIEELQATTYLVLKKFYKKSSPSASSKNLCVVRDKGNTVPIHFNDILFFKADGLYTIIQTKSKSYMSRNILKDMAKDLPKDKFVRVHKSYVINFKEVTSFNSKEIQIGDYTIPLRRGSLKEMKALIQSDPSSHTLK